MATAVQFEETAVYLIGTTFAWQRALCNKQASVFFFFEYIRLFLGFRIIHNVSSKSAKRLRKSGQ